MEHVSTIILLVSSVLLCCVVVNYAVDVCQNTLNVSSGQYDRIRQMINETEQQTNNLYNQTVTITNQTVTNSTNP
jgi:arginine utilization protein RocB